MAGSSEGGARPAAHVRLVEFHDARTGLQAHCDTAESVHALFKRAIVGVFHWISGKHLDRYLREVAFHWNIAAQLRGG